MWPKNIDLVDRKILAQLDKNARISYSELGKRMRIAKETVKYRIGQLQKKGIIKGFYTVINLSKIGFTVYRVYLRLQNTSPKLEQEITKYLSTSKNVAVLYRTNGPFHIAVGVWARDVWEYEQFLSELKRRFGTYFSMSQISIICEYLEFSRPYFLPGESEKETYTTITKAKPEELDEIDFRLLVLISNNGRASTVEIAKKLGVSIVTARYRLKSLIKRKVIGGFRLILNLNAIGREYYKVDLWLSKFERREEILNHILANENVIYTERTLGGGDLEFDIEAEGFGEFIQIMDSFRSEFPDDISYYSYYSLVENCKTSYIPSL